MSYKDFITEIPNFPIDGVNFKDISPLLANEQVFRSALVEMGDKVDAGFNRPDYWIGIDSRGYIFSSGLATYFGGGVVCARKEGKTPGDKVSVSYDLEYGSATLEMGKVGMGGGEVVIVDDVLATGGTSQAAVDVLTKAGYTPVAALFPVELTFLNPTLSIPYESVIKY